jgi:hypothetical protein
MRLSDHALRELTEGTLLATILLGAQEGGRPLNEASWILLGVALTTLADAYATHLSDRGHDDVRAYVGSIWLGIVENSPRTIASFPAVVLLMCAWVFHWGGDHRSPDGTAVAGYETLVLNVNVVLLFVFGFLAARRSGASVRGTIVFGLMNAALGWLIVTVELAID